MRRLHYRRNGVPSEVIELQHVEEPRPGTGEVVIALEASPLHIADLKAIAGSLDFIPLGPGVPGFEGVGTVVRCGARVRGWSEGDRAVLPMAYGAWQERRAVAADTLWRAPLHLPAEQLALVRVNLTTAYLLLHAFTTLQPGDWIIQNAANSNVGYYVATLARHLGIGVIDVVRRPEVAAALRARGRTHVHLDGPELRDSIAPLVPRLALDAIGGDATRRLGGCVAEDGLVLCYGFLAEQPYSIDYHDAMFRGVRLEAMMIDRASRRLGVEGVHRMAEMIQAFLAAVPLEAEIAAVYRFDEAAEALRRAARTGAERMGKIILRP